MNKHDVHVTDCPDLLGESIPPRELEALSIGGESDGLPGDPSFFLAMAATRENQNG